MAPKAYLNNAATLSEMATLIDLLALRGGESTDRELEDNNDLSDSSPGTTRRHVLTPSRNKAYKQFLHRISEAFAVKRNGSYVTAAVLKEVDQEARVDVWLARNVGFSETSDQKMVEHIESVLNQQEQGINQDGKHTDLLAKMVCYLSPRLRFYHQVLRETLVPHQAELEDDTRGFFSAVPEHASQIWRDIYSHFFGSPVCETESAALEDLVRIGHNVRQSIQVARNVTTSSSRSKWMSKVFNTLCLVGKVFAAYEVFNRMSTSTWSGYTVKIHLVLEKIGPPPPAARGFTLAAALQYVNVPATDPAVRRFISGSKAQSNFATVQKQRKHVHAEIQLLFHLAKLGVRNMYPYMGTSKLPCVLCSEYLEAEGTFTFRHTHEHLYPKWMVPQMSTLPETVSASLRKANMKMNVALRRRLMSDPVKGKDPRPESTVDFTMVSEAAATAEAAQQHSVAQFMDQWHRAKEQDNITRIIYPQSAQSSRLDLESGFVHDENAPDVTPPTRTVEDTSDDECEGCPRLTSRRCSRCGKGRFCNSSCETRMGPIHKFGCSNGPLTTADYLMCDCAGNTIPEDPDVIEDFGFKNLWTFPDRSKLLGLYQGLVYLDITADDLHEWRVSGTLVDRIIETFEHLPANSRGGYFPWFVVNRHRIFPDGTVSVQPVDYFEQSLRAAKFVLEPSDQTKTVLELQPETKRKAFLLAAMIMQLTHPSPDLAGMYEAFGFCACIGEDEERKLAFLYQDLIFGDARLTSGLYWGHVKPSDAIVSNFSEFWQAFDRGKLADLIARKGLTTSRDRIRNLKDYLNGCSEVRNFSVWKLQTFLNSTGTETPPTEVFLNYKFVRCPSPLAKSQLKQLYVRLVSQVNLVQLHKAQIAGQLLELARRHMDVDPIMTKILQC